MDWTSDLPTWSLPHLSRPVDLSPHRWHIQECGRGPLVLLLPGSGSSVHTWRHLIPALSETYRVVALDLPGQGFTRSPRNSRSGLEEMASDIASLLRDQNLQPDSIISHSAGTAIALRLSQLIDVPSIVGINPALDNFRGVAGWLFPLIARTLAMSPFTASIFAASATPDRSRRLIESTGSRLDDEGLGFYARLMRDRSHVCGTLNMMARWSLEPLLADLPTIETRTLFLAGSDDRAVPPEVSSRSATLMRHAEARLLQDMGHLAHEEAPHRILTEIQDFLPAL